MCVDYFFGLSLFSDVRGARSGVPCKPDPTAARDIATQLGCDVQHCLYLGDSGVDMQTASAAGMFAVGALWGFRPRDELIQCGAQQLVNDPRQVIELLASS
jgi:phosphoglycolate phosphatase